MIEIQWNPSPRDQRQFAFIWLPAFFALLGGIVYWRTGSFAIPQWIWGMGLVLSILGWTIPAIRRPLYVTWMCAAFPIGWTVSHVILILVFYGVITPIGLLIRLLGHDAMTRRFDSSAESYWMRRSSQRADSDYFRQY